MFRWVGIGALCVAVLFGLAYLFDLGPFAEEELTTPAFLAAADGICAEAHSDFEQVQEAQPATASAAAAVTEELLAISRDELEGIEDLEVPATLEKPLEQYLDARREGIDEMRAGLEAAQRGDAFAYADAQAAVASTQVERLTLAKGLGLTECSRVLFGREQLEKTAKTPAQGDPTAPPGTP